MDELMIGIFAFFGGSLRLLVEQIIPTIHMPVATLSINLLGSFALAWLFGMAGRLRRISPRLNMALGTGFVGAFTTFSTLTQEVYRLILAHHWEIAVSYILLSMVGGTFLAGLGLWVSHGRQKVKIDD